MSAGLSIPVEIVAQSLGSGGVTICVPAAEPLGKKIFVAGVIPGETADIAITKDQKNFCEGKLIQIKTPHTNRVVPPCVYIKYCGGCSFQHMTIEQERVEKTKMVKSYLQRQAGVAIHEVIDASEGLPEYNYRRRITLHLSHDGQLGFHKPGTGQVIPIGECLLAENEINKVIPALQSTAERLSIFAKSVEINHEQKINLVIFLRNQISSETFLSEGQWLRKLLSLGSVFLRSRTSTVQVIQERTKLRLKNSDQSIGHFSQVNRRGNKILHDLVMSSIDVDPPSLITELYAGSGNFTIPLAKKGFAIEAAEFDAQLVKAGQKAISDLKLQEKVKFYQSSCEQYVRRAKMLGRLVILDPPRAGAKDVIKLADWSNTDTILYISCDLASFSRDVAMLQKENGFAVEKVYFVDMFPRTAHVEIVGILKKKPE